MTFFFNVKINKGKGKIPKTSNLATTTALTTVENKISDIVVGFIRLFEPLGYFSRKTLF